MQQKLGEEVDESSTQLQSTFPARRADLHLRGSAGTLANGGPRGDAQAGDLAKWDHDARRLLDDSNRVKSSRFRFGDQHPAKRPMEAEHKTLNITVEERIP
jgi:hypothetical protein